MALVKKILGTTTNLDKPVPTMVHTLVSPMSTCQRAPEEAPESLPVCRLPAEPAEVGRRRGFEALLFDKPPALDEPRFGFLTRPPSLEGNSMGFGIGDASSLRAADDGPDPK